MRALPGERPESLTGEADGQTLEQIVGELQEIWGTPESPQEYRLMIKVAIEPEERGQAATVEETIEDPPDDSSIDPLSPRREKAPAAPRISGNARTASPSREESEGSAKRRRSRRRRKSRGRGRGAAEGS